MPPTASPPAPAAQPGLGRLLLATEHTEQDRGAEAVAFALARIDLSHPLHPLAAVMPLASNPEYETVAPQTAARAEADFGRRRDALQAAAGVPMDLHVRRGSDLAAEIVAEATERGADLLVIRRRGQRGRLAQLLIGEMVSRVLAQAPCSVLVAPREATLWRRGVLACIDGTGDTEDSHPADPRPDSLSAAPAAPAAPTAPAWAAVLSGAVRAARAASVPLHLLCVVANAGGRERGERALARARAAAEALGPGVPISATLRIGPAHERIVLAATELDADLVVLARGGGQWLGRAWIGDLAEKVIGQAPCPVLAVVPAPGHAGGPAAAR